MRSFGLGRPRFVAAQAGDLVVWDSRTVHCNTIGLASVKGDSKDGEEEEEEEERRMTLLGSE